MKLPRQTAAYLAAMITWQRVHAGTSITTVHHTFNSSFTLQCAATCDPSLCACISSTKDPASCAKELNSVCTSGEIDDCVPPNGINQFRALHCPYAACIVDGGTREECACDLYERTCEIFGDEENMGYCVLAECCRGHNDDAWLGECLKDGMLEDNGVGVTNLAPAVSTEQSNGNQSQNSFMVDDSMLLDDDASGFNSDNQITWILPPSPSPTYAITAHDSSSFIDSKFTLDLGFARFCSSNCDTSLCSCLMEKEDFSSCISELYSSCADNSISFCVPDIIVVDFKKVYCPYSECVVNGSSVGKTPEQCSCERYSGLCGLKGDDESCRISSCCSEQQTDEGKLICLDAVNALLEQPLSIPTKDPTPSPVFSPSTYSPTSSWPTTSPTQAPSTNQPSHSPSIGPTNSPTASPVTKKPSNRPTSKPSEQPTAAPITHEPTDGPSAGPSNAPTMSPVTNKPSTTLSSKPLDEPSQGPSGGPSNVPTASPVTYKPSNRPTAKPTYQPTDAPVTMSPSQSPVGSPSSPPTGSPVTSKPTKSPTTTPSSPPTVEPTVVPSQSSSDSPSSWPTTLPSTNEPSRRPTSAPVTMKPTLSPNESPTSRPTIPPVTIDPTNQPSRKPSDSPSTSPVVTVTNSATDSPTGSKDFGEKTPVYCPPAYDPLWSSSYVAGSQVEVDGTIYECNQYPYSIYCSLTDYRPVYGNEYWDDAWAEISSCNFTDEPTESPTASPTTMEPTKQPTNRPSTMSPSVSPSTNKPTKRLTKQPTNAPTPKSPTRNPTTPPSSNPTQYSSQSPNKDPTVSPRIEVKSLVQFQMQTMTKKMNDYEVYGVFQPSCKNFLKMQLIDEEPHMFDIDCKVTDQQLFSQRMLIDSSLRRLDELSSLLVDVEATGLVVQSENVTSASDVNFDDLVNEAFAKNGVFFMNSLKNKGDLAGIETFDELYSVTSVEQSNDKSAVSEETGSDIEGVNTGALAAILIGAVAIVVLFAAFIFHMINRADDDTLTNDEELDGVMGDLGITGFQSTPVNQDYPNVLSEDSANRNDNLTYAFSLENGIDSPNSLVSASKLAWEEGAPARVRREVMAPPGKLGIIIDTSTKGPIVHSVKDESVLEGSVFAGDLIIALDDEDTSNWSAHHLTKLVAAKSKCERKITVLSMVSS